MGAHGAEVIAIQKPVQLLARERDGVALQAVRPLEALPLQALVPDHEAITLPEQQLHLVTLAVAEHEDRLLEGIELHGLLNQQGQSIDLLAHVDRLATQVDAQPGVRRIIGPPPRRRSAAAGGEVARARPVPPGAAPTPAATPVPVLAPRRIHSAPVAGKRHGTGGPASRPVSRSGRSWCPPCYRMTPV